MSWNEYTNICTYRVKPGARGQFIELLRKHWPALRDAGLATATPALHFEADVGGQSRHNESGTTFAEIFSWSRPDAPSLRGRSRRAEPPQRVGDDICRDLQLVAPRRSPAGAQHTGRHGGLGAHGRSGGSTRWTSRDGVSQLPAAQSRCLMLPLQSKPPSACSPRWLIRHAATFC